MAPRSRDGHHAWSVDATGGEAWRDGRAWRIGGAGEVGWITARTASGTTITSAVPDVFEAYATVVVPDNERQKRDADQALLALLREHSPDQPWWLGYLETGASDVVFPYAPRVLLYAGWSYVLVEAGPDEAAGWRTYDDALPWHTELPELIFPQDHSWLVSTLWDDDWSCIGGPATLVSAILDHQHLDARAVAPGEDATPLGHHAQ